MAEVIVRSDGRLRQRIEGDGHVILADEPRTAGGNDAGPNPYTLLLGALGACTAMTLQLYARRKGWPLQSVEVRLSHERSYIEDCERLEDDCRIERITRQLTLLGPLDETQRARLLEIAAQCPVHKTLTGPIEIIDELRATNDEHRANSALPSAAGK